MWPGRVKVSLLIFKDEKTKDAVSYHSWDIAIFCHSGWDDQHLLPCVFWSLQGFPGDLARSLGEDTTLNDVLQTLAKHFGVVMTFNTLSKELYSLKQGSGEKMAKFRVHLSQQVQIFQSEYPERTQQWVGSEITTTRAWTPYTDVRWPIKLMMSTLPDTLICL